MNDTDTVAAVMAAAGLMPEGAAVHSAHLPGGVAVHGMRVEVGQAEQAWHLWHQRPGLVPFLTTWIASPADLREMAAVAAAHPQPVVGVSTEEAARTVAEVVRRVNARRIAEADPDDLAEEEELSDPVRLARLLDEPTGTAVPGEPLAFMPSWGIENLWLVLVEADAGHRLPWLLPGFLSEAVSPWPETRPFSPAEHAAFLQHWNARHGAEVFFLGGSKLQLRVTRPPLDGPSIAALAIEQNVYCDDLDDVVDTANGQVRSTVWSFWWD